MKKEITWKTTVQMALLFQVNPNKIGFSFVFITGIVLLRPII
jgi:hypothetical protein